MAHQDEGRRCAAASIRLTLPVPISYTAPTTFTFPCCTKRLKTGSAVLRRCAFSRTFSTIARSTRSGAEGSVFFTFLTAGLRDWIKCAKCPGRAVFAWRTCRSAWIATQLLLARIIIRGTDKNLIAYSRLARPSSFTKLPARRTGKRFLGPEQNTSSAETPKPRQPET